MRYDKLMYRITIFIENQSSLKTIHCVEYFRYKPNTQYLVT